MYGERVPSPTAQQALRELVAELAAQPSIRAIHSEELGVACFWSPESEISARLKAVEDELWLMAGTSVLYRTVADTGGSFGVDRVLLSVLAGRAVEYFVHAGRPVAANVGFEVWDEDGQAIGGGAPDLEGIVRIPILGPFEDDPTVWEVVQG